VSSAAAGESERVGRGPTRPALYPDDRTAADGTQRPGASLRKHRGDTAYLSLSRRSAGPPKWPIHSRRRSLTTDLRSLSGQPLRSEYSAPTRSRAQLGTVLPRSMCRCGEDSERRRTTTLQGVHHPIHTVSHTLSIPLGVSSPTPHSHPGLSRRSAQRYARALSLPAQPPPIVVASWPWFLCACGGLGGSSARPFPSRTIPFPPRRPPQGKMPDDSCKARGACMYPPHPSLAVVTIDWTRQPPRHRARTALVPLSIDGGHPLPRAAPEA
jgi:hypothetical protein